MTRFRLLIPAALLAGCSALTGPPPVPGDSLETVRAKLGEPTAVHRLAAGTQLEYSGPFAQQAQMARFDAHGRLVSLEQVRTDGHFAALRPGVATKAEVLAAVGHPSETSRIHMKNYEVWSYRYLQSGVWNAMMHIHFDERGTVQLLQSGPDPMYEDKRRF